MPAAPRADPAAAHSAGADAAATSPKASASSAEVVALGDVGAASSVYAPNTASALSAEGQPIPTYATRLPTNTELTFRLLRGSREGKARLNWSTAQGQYEASLQGQLEGGPGFEWRSEGEIDSAGIAPGRFVARQQGRGAQAVNLHRDQARVSFSGAVGHAPWVPGTQDRLSWMLQLSAVLNAAPERASPGQKVVMWIVGPRGEAWPWVFESRGPLKLPLPDGGEISTVHWVRLPTRRFDTAAEIWLDPSRQYLPVRLSMRPTGEGQGLELWRLE